MRKPVFGDDLNRSAQLQNLQFWTYSRYYIDAIQAANNKGTDQTAQMSRLIYAFVVRIWHKIHFLMMWLIKIWYKYIMKFHKLTLSNN